METPKKVLVVMGSPRKGNTYRAAERIRELMKVHGPVEFEYLWLRDAKLLPCRGCAICVAKGEENCPNRDDMPDIVQKMREADGVILASPVFSWAVTGQFKIFIDRLSYTMHRPQFYDKKALLLSTAMFRTKEVENYLSRVAQFWGFEITGKAGLITPPSVPARQQEKNERILAKAAESLPALSQGGGRAPDLGKSSCSTAGVRLSTSKKMIHRSIISTGRSTDGSSQGPGFTSTCRSTPFIP
jgi:multimeric flavodoxin WrbA